ncbi:hypothetical protein OIDMADRAFT_45659 [Oidiodendron maius Zn]|uniref:FAD-binding domain-containing protein n=1 Tax=Oidiodendron maius (strain Zn) TaxID=913774 RepID=A0A0C3GF42_OIDMZ|nr:hypothetical protein OIDMADRAFT_45659 [Oidiodendron maius Zn]
MANTEMATVEDRATHPPLCRPSGVFLNVGIVGAGIAGLAAAAALSRIGHNVELYERSQFSNEVGAAINLGPNAGPVLEALGFDHERARTMSVAEGIQYEASTLKETYHGNYEHFEYQYGAPWFFVHRVDLHNELKTLALAPSDGFPAVKLNLSTPVVDVNCEAGTLTLADGSTVRKDVIIGADGVHSIVAHRVLGKDIPAASVGECAFRFLIPTETLLQNETTRPLFSGKKTALNIAATCDRRLIWYPCRNGDIQNFVALHPAKDDNKDDEDWQADGKIEDLIQTFEKFHPSLVEVCRNAQDLKLWKLLYRAPIRQWSKGKVIIIGDAAHPMLPHQGQGGNQAIEDAGALAMLLSELQSLEDVPRRLELVQNIRRDRAGAMQILSNAGQDEAHRVEKDAMAYVHGPIPSNLRASEWMRH